MPESDRKVFVLDTSVALYDHNSLTSFEEHDVALPITVLEELDGFKKGGNVINLNAREFLRQVDRISERHDLRNWVSINGSDTGRVRVVVSENGHGPRRGQSSGILEAALQVAQGEQQRPVILVTKDINLRVKARAFGLRAEDYETVRIRDVDRLYEGHSTVEIEDGDLDRLHRDGHAPWEVLGREEPPEANHYFVLRAQAKSALAYFDGASGQLQRIHKGNAYGITPRNAEQVFALHAVLNPKVPLVTVSGAAGTGKTLLALAGCLEQRREFRQILLARPIVPLSNKDLGFLPGDIQSKLTPFMQPLADGLAVIKAQAKQDGARARKIDEMQELGKIEIIPLAYIRGRSFSHIAFVVDESQNLTPHEIKTVITRAGAGTKIILTGDVFQIDTPYLDAQSNGLSYLIDRLRGQSLYAHVTLQKGERSELANLASELL